MRWSLIFISCFFAFALLTAPVAAQDVVWIDDFGVCNNTSIQVPVFISNPNTAVDSFTFDLTFDNSVLTYVNVTASDLTSSWPLLSGNEATPGIVTVGGMTTGDPIPTHTEGILLYVNFTCASCTAGSTSTFVFSNLLDDLSSFSSTNGSFTYFSGCGITVDSASGCNGTIQVGVSVSGTTPIRSFSFDLTYDTAMLTYQSCSQSGLLTDDWSFFICNEVAGSPGVVTVTGSIAYGGTEIPAASSGDLVELTFAISCSGCAEDDVSALSLSNLQDDISDYDITDGGFTYHCGTPGPASLVVINTNGTAGDTIQVPVRFADSPNDVDSMGFTITYCTDMLQFTGCTTGSLTTNFDYFDCNESSPGTINFGAFDAPATPPAIPAGSSGNVLILNFTVTCSACTVGDTCSIQLSDLADDVEYWDTENGVFLFGEQLLPTMNSLGLVMLLIALSAVILFALNRKRNMDQSGL